MTPPIRFQVFLVWCLTSCTFPTHSYSINPSRSTKKTPPVHPSRPHFIPTSSSTRRAFFSGAASAATAAVVAVASDPVPGALAATPPPPSSQVIKVTPLAHTFSVSKGAAKPVRENDATRTLANARIVYLFEGPAGGGGGGGDNARTVEDILRLTAARKAEAGPGVTPGNVKLVCHASGTGVSAVGDHRDFAAVAEGCGVEVVRVRNPHDLKVVASLATSGGGTSDALGDGDVLFVCPQPSGGTARDAKVVDDCANLAKLDVGGAKSGGVLSVLVNGPRSPDALNVVEGGFETSTVLWYEA